MQLTGAEIIVECLKEQGVDTVFGYPGGAILNVYDALYEYPKREKMQKPLSILPWSTLTLKLAE